MNWQPHITVAAVVSHNDHFLMVQERSPNGDLVFNQPAGHLEAGESFTEGLIRETLEETRWLVQPEAILSFNLYTSPANGVTYLRCNFLATPIRENKEAILDKDIEQALWMTEAEINEQQERHRSPMVLRAIADFNSGQRYPLSMIYHHLMPHG